MNFKLHIYIISLLVLIANNANANEALTEEQLNTVLTSLMNQTKSTWIPSGSIEGVHTHINPESDEIINTIEKIVYDTDNFCWEIEIKSHTNMDLVPKNNSDILLNKKRTFSLNGNEYTMYFKSGRNAIVSADYVGIPINVNGPLKAAVIPWGHGIYNRDKIEENLVSAVFNKKENVIITIKNNNAYSLEIELDPAKNHAVLSRILTKPNKSQISDTYTDYTKHGDHWIPSTILTESLDHVSENSSNYKVDMWQITSVDLSKPSSTSLKVNYEDNTHVEYRASGKVMSYRHKTGRNTEYMLEHRKYNAFSGNRPDRNCATAAITYILSCLGKEIEPSDLDSLVTGTEKTTTFFQVDKFVKENQLQNIAIKTDLKTLTELEDCYVLLHLNKAQHYVILDYIDQENVWLIDLDSDKFYYKLPIDEFNRQWSTNTAMIISDKPITIPHGSTIISEDQMLKIKGSAGGFGTYSCTDLIQEYNVLTCSESMGICVDRYTIWYNRYACELDDGGGYCSGDKLIGSISANCIEDPSNPNSCISEGIWTSYYMHSCN